MQRGQWPIYISTLDCSLRINVLNSCYSETWCTLCTVGTQHICSIECSLSINVLNSCCSKTWCTLLELSSAVPLLAFHENVVFFMLKVVFQDLKVNVYFSPIIESNYWGMTFLKTTAAYKHKVKQLEVFQHERWKHEKKKLNWHDGPISITF